MTWWPAIGKVAGLRQVLENVIDAVVSGYRDEYPHLETSRAAVLDVYDQWFKTKAHFTRTEEGT